MRSVITEYTERLCPACEHCGGCIYQGTPYEEQLAAKDKAVRRLLDKHDIDQDVYLGMEPAICTGRYRNKMEYTFGDLEKGGELELGMHYKGRFMSIITTDECQLVPPSFNIVLRAVLDFCRKNGYVPYHRKTHLGLLRNLVVRCGVRTNELLINIVTSSEPGFDEEGFRELLLGLDLRSDEEKAKGISADESMRIVGILRTFNDSVADAVIDESHKLLYGRDYYNEEILGLRFKVKAFAFFQTNIDAVERLYSDVLEVVPDVSGKTVYDLYCGTGTISQLMASKAKEVYGIDIVEDSITAARSNTELNGIGNCHYICGDVKEKLDEIPVKPDVIVVDPPRVGIHDKAVAMLCRYGIDEIVYVSCNPKTLCINLDSFRSNGYEIKQIKAYDNFPMTKHVETVCLLSKGEISSKNVRIEFPMEEMDMSGFQFGATYEEIQNWVQ
ncbi:MAG: 23S rRNA (uracil(1939)-C(5))-methyltransferase RlmD, partial [Mogibacterium sp.]|nr:23S rRNA (uracil(1939)-C(5))-methyltransferase RlmD [Mogibacterium sp.]